MLDRPLLCWGRSLMHATLFCDGANEIMRRRNSATFRPCEHVYHAAQIIRRLLVSLLTPREMAIW